jgi:hypothetical protein
MRFISLSILLTLLVPFLALATPGVQRHGDLNIHYNALPATALPTQSLKQLGVSDAAHKGLLNVLVMHGSDTSGSSVPADVQARAMTETGAPVRVDVREIREDGNVTYVGIFPLESSGKLRFDLDVTPHGETTQHIQFQKDFMVD